MRKVLCGIFVMSVAAGPVTLASAQGFASDVAVSADAVLVAEPFNEMAPGAIYVFQKGATGEWTEAAQITASDGFDGDRFGRAVAADDRTLVVGATGRQNGTGAAYVFVRTPTGGWNESAMLVAADGAEGDEFGGSVALHDDIALVSSWAHADGSGAVYVFRRTGSRWTQEDKLMAGTGSDVPFGRVLATDGSLIAVGAPVPQFRFGGRQNAAAEERKGAVFLYQRSPSGTWTDAGQIPEPEGVQAGGFGSAVTMVAGRIYIGASGQNRGVGAAYIYARNDDGEWETSGVLQPFDIVGRPQFAAAMASNEGDLLIGTPGADGTGKIYGFHVGADGSWDRVSKIAGVPDLESRDRFASVLAARGDLAVAGVPGDDFGAGTAVVLERSNGEWVATQKVWGADKGFAAVTGSEVECTQGVASVFDCEEVDMVSFLPIKDLGGSRGVRLNDVWGWTDPQTGKEYAIVGRLDGTSFVDVSNPNQPRYLGNLAKTPTARASTWRDMKVYENHVFIVADGAGEHGMQVFDLTQLRNVRNAPVEFEETAHYGGIFSAHNIVINEATGFAFAVGSSAGGETCGGGLHMINIQDPGSPRFAGCFADPNTGRRGTGYSHDAQCVTYHGPDTDHAGKEICLGSNETALSISDVSDKEQPVALAMATYPNVGYSHQGWLTEDHRYFYMNDELDELSGNVVGTRTLVWDVTDLDDPVLVKEHMSENLASDHNLYVRGNYMYQSNYQSGLRVLDVSDPENPRQVGFFDTVPYGEDTPGFGGSWSNYPFFESGLVIVTSGREGLFVLKKRPQEIIP